MIKLVKANNPVNFALMFFLMLTVWAFKFYYMPTEIETYELSNYFLPQFPETVFMKYLSAVLSFMLYYGFALIIIKINSNSIIIENAYQAPGIVFVLLTGFFINAQRVLPETIASIILFFAIIRIFGTYQKLSTNKYVFDAAILVAISSLLVHKLIFAIPLILIVLIIIKPIKVKEFIVFFTGILITYIVVITIIWLLGDLDSVYQTVLSAMKFKYTDFKYVALNYIVFLPIIILSLIAIISKFTIDTPKKISTRRFQTSIVLILVVLSLFFLGPYSTNESVILLFPWLSLLISNVLINAKKIFVSIIFGGLILSLVAVQIVQIAYYLSLY
ncbi:MAG: DUF6427 family protein [Bacteroidales bacterium]|nr:DUF6427 family protein [Bacteroidales bacterium]MDD4217088.1 DUF6427 family protein [Bacteroidales bacterium]